MNNIPSAIIEVSDVWKSYDHGKIPVLQGVSLAIAPGKIVALWGPSGSGKSTLLHLLGGLDTADRGTVSISGIQPLREAERLHLRRSLVGFVFQLHNLIPDLSLTENCLIPAIAVKMPMAAAQERLATLLEEVGLGHRRKHRVQDLSGGERQRAAIVRALMLRPKILLADEPTGSLDEQTGEVVFELFCRLARVDNTTVVLATHERRFAEACERIFSVRGGHVEEVVRSP